MADGAEQLLGHPLGGGGQAHPAAVARAVGVARRAVAGAAAGARLGLAGDAVVGGLRLHDRQHGVEQGEVDHLSPPGALGMAQRDQGGGGAVEAGVGVAHEHRRQHRLAVGEAVYGGEARVALDQRAEARLVPVRARLPPAGDAHHHQPGIGRQQGLGRQPHLLQHAGAEALDQHGGPGGESAHGVLRRRVAEPEADALLVAAPGLPRRLDAADLPGAQRVALGGLDLDHLGAVVGEHLGQQVAGDEARQVHHAHAVQGTGGGGVERLADEGSRIVGVHARPHSTRTLAAAATSRQRARSSRRKRSASAAVPREGVAPSPVR